MIAIYNETRIPWEVKLMHEKALCLTKVKTYTRDTTDVRRSAHIFSYSNIFDDFKLDNVVEMMNQSFVGMRDVKVLMPKTTSIVFSKKDYNPFITPSDRNVKDIFMISIDLKGRKIVNLSNENIFILETFILGGELTLIASLNKFDSVLRIKLWDEVTNTITVYTFTCEATTPYLLITDEVPTGSESTYMLFLKKFRPARPTFTILALEKDMASLQKLVNPEQHEIISITNDNTTDVITDLITKNYKAVTFFTNTQITNASDSSYRDLANALYAAFNLYYEMSNTGKIFKSKV